MSENLSYHHAFTALKDIYLEDSWVLGVFEKERSILFDMEFVLTKKHQNYSTPKADEQYCYIRGQLHLMNCSSIHLQKTMEKPSTDANGEKDFGNIDSFTTTDGQVSLAGNWGVLKASCNSVVVNIETEARNS